MAKGEITINEMMCQGCGFCVQYCPSNCVAFVGEKMSARGYLVPTLAKPEDCTGCAICGWMCPHMAIEVYKFQQEPVKK
ncbi:MAG: 4Fe-4S dicluster domain-containing protein [Dehalococcoidia bacterium]